MKDKSRGPGTRTYLATKVNDRTSRVVIKMIERGSSTTRSVSRELEIHRSCSGHPYIAQLRDVFLTPNYLAIVMDFAEGKNLGKKISKDGPLHEDEARVIFQQLCLTLQFMHENDYRNRDLKLENMIVAEGVDDSVSAFAIQGKLLTLQDFMYSSTNQINSDPREAFNSLPYTAPELLMHEKSDSNRDSDVWSLGVALYKMVFNMFPFEREEDGPTSYRTVPKVISRIANMDYHIPDHASDDLRDLLKKILVPEPKDRVDINGIMCHSWFTKTPHPSMEDVRMAVKSSECPVTVEAMLTYLSRAKSMDDRARSRDIEEVTEEILRQERMHG